MDGDVNIISHLQLENCSWYSWFEKCFAEDADNVLSDPLERSLVVEWAIAVQINSLDDGYSWALLPCEYKCDLLAGHNCIQDHERQVYLFQPFPNEFTEPPLKAASHFLHCLIYVQAKGDIVVNVLHGLFLSVILRIKAHPHSKWIMFV